MESKDEAPGFSMERLVCMRTCRVTPLLMGVADQALNLESMVLVRAVVMMLKDDMNAEWGRHC
jgi:hypothetical protein